MRGKSVIVYEDEDCCCGPQAWPKWIRRPLSRFYNRACKNHDANYSTDEVSLSDAEQQFRTEIARRQSVMWKAFKRKKISLREVLLHGVLFGYMMPVLTGLGGWAFKSNKK